MEMDLKAEIDLVNLADNSFAKALTDGTSNRNQLERAAFAEGLCFALFMMTGDTRWSARAATMSKRRDSLREKVSKDGEDQPTKETNRDTDDAG